MDVPGWDPPPLTDARPASAEARVIVAEDHALLRRGMVMALDNTGGEFHVVAQAVSAPHVVELTVRLRPDLSSSDPCVLGWTAPPPLSASGWRPPGSAS